MAYRDMLSTVADRIQALIDEGKSDAEILAAAPTREYDEQLGGGFLNAEQWVPLVTSSLRDN